MEPSVPPSDPEQVRRLREALVEDGGLAAELAAAHPPKRTCPRCGGPLSRDGTACPGCTLPMSELGRGDDPSTAITGGEFRFGKYHVLREIGRGGMGVVYLARDPNLGREVALKLLLSGARPQDEERFLREARLAASLDHPAIVPIHEVGVCDGRPYISMAYAEGRTFRDVLLDDREMEMRQRVLLLHAVTEGVAHAHERRIIHRDLKPSNIVVDEKARVHVLDFGLARRLDDDSFVTRTGEAMGTPQYMAPEQIECSPEVGPATDVYALGLILYEAITGTYPYQSRTLGDLMERLLRDDPPSARKANPRVPIDLETICLRAMRRKPSERYPTARELAEDLGRFCRGEAIQARRESSLETALRWMRKRKTLCALAAAVFVALAIAGWLGLERRRLGEENLANLRFVERLTVEGALAVRRAGGRMADAESQFLGPLQTAAERVIKEAPELPEPHYVLGRMYRALLRFDEAHREQTLALALDPAYPPSLYERAILNARRYDERRDQMRRERLREMGRRLAQEGLLERGGFAGERTDPGVDLESESRDPLLQELARSIERDVWKLSPGAGAAPGRFECATGVLAMLRGNWEEGRRILQQALDRDPTLEEAYEGLATGAWQAGETSAALEWARRGQRVDKGYIPHLLHQARALDGLAWEGGPEGRDPEAFYREAIAACDEALDLAPGHVEACVFRARIYQSWAFSSEGRGGDPSEIYDRSLRALGEFLHRHPSCAEARLQRADLCTQWSQYRMEHGGETKALLAQAVQDGDAACAGLPDSAKALSVRGMARQACGLEAWWRDEEETRRWFRSAVADLSASLAMDPSDLYCLIARATVRSNLAFMATDPRPDPALLSDALADFNAALDREPNDSAALEGRARARLYLGDTQRERGQDPTEAYATAEVDMNRMLAASPALPGALVGRACIHIGRGRYADAQGSDAARHLELAIRDLDAAIAADAACGTAYWTRGRVRFLRGERSGAAADFAKARTFCPADDPECGEMEKNLERR